MNFKQSDKSVCTLKHVAEEELSNRQKWKWTAAWSWNLEQQGATVSWDVTLYSAVEHYLKAHVGKFK